MNEITTEENLNAEQVPILYQIIFNKIIEAYKKKGWAGLDTKENRITTAEFRFLISHINTGHRKEWFKVAKDFERFGLVSVSKRYIVFKKGVVNG